MELRETSVTYDSTLFRHYHLCQYLPLTAGVDIISRSLLKFKRGIQPDLDAWIDCTLEAFQNIPLSPDTIIIRALSHDEPKARETPPTPLDLLGRALAASFRCRYLPSLLRKSRPTLSNKGLTRRQRQTELQDIYSLTPEALSLISPPNPSEPTPPANPTPPPFLLIDDILTTGATLRAIIHALRQTLPLSPLQAFTLAKADYTPDLNPSAPLQSQHYHLEDQTGWIVAEDPVPYNSLHELKKAIRSNFV